MRSLLRWTAVVLLLLLALVAMAAGALWHWTSSDDFRTRAGQAASDALGVPVQLRRIDLALWPLFAVAVHDVQVQTRPPLRLERVEAHPAWRSLLAGRAEFDALVVRNAQLPQRGLVALATALQKDGSQPAAPAVALPRRVVLEQVTWVDEQGRPLTVDAHLAFAGEPLPQSAQVLVTGGRFQGARATLERQQDAWQLRAHIGGGTVAGPLRMRTLPTGGWNLSGEFATERVEVAALTAPSRTLTGRIDARTTLQAQFKEASQLADALRSQTRFTVRQAVVHGIDLAQAVRSRGASRSGRTALDTLTGQVTTQGRAVQLANLVAASGLLNAQGHVSLSPERQLAGRVTVALAAGPVGTLAGVPLQVGGTLDTPTVMPAGLTLPSAGAASQLGDRLGSGLRSLFGR